MVVFDSDADNLVDVFWRDTVTGITVRASLSSTNQQVGKGSANATLSGDGRFVGFVTAAAFVPDDTNGVEDDYRRGPMF